MSYYDDASLVLIPSGVKASKVYSQKPTNGSGDFTFARASTATRTNASGAIVSVASNVPRLDYMTASGTLATCPMLELEQQRTNLVLRSEEFDNVYWSKPVGSVVANAAISPDGTQDADQFTILITGESIFSADITVSSSTVYTWSFYAKKGTATQHYLAIRDQTNGVFISSDVQYTVSSTNWTRVTHTFTTPATCTSVRCYPQRYSLGGIGTHFFWGAQLELGSFVSTYIPTTAATVTRIKDDLSISGASALIGQTECTIFIDVDFRVVSSGGIRTFFGLEGSVTNQFSGFSVATTSNGNNIQYAGTVYNLTQGRHKIVCTYNSATNVSKLFVDGAQRGASTFAAFASTIDRISILGRINPFNSFQVDRQQFGGCNQFALWKTALTYAQCIKLSTL